MSNNNGNSSAMPQNMTVHDGLAQSNEEYCTTTMGLTKREILAMSAMNAWIVHHGVKDDYGYSDQEMAESSLRAADALLEALEK